MDKQTQMPLAVGLRDDFSFENFYVEHNHPNLALLECLQSETEDNLYLWGEAGAGVSHLLSAFVKNQSKRGRQALYLSLSELDQSAPEILNHLDGYDCIVLDDLDAIRGKPQWETALFALYNQCFDQRTQMLFGAKAAPMQIDLGLADLQSRLSASSIWCVYALNDAQRVKALVERAELRGFDLPTQIAAYMVNHLDRNMTSLVHVLDLIDRGSLRLQHKVTLPLIKQLLAEEPL